MLTGGFLISVGLLLQLVATCFAAVTLLRSLRSAISPGKALRSYAVAVVALALGVLVFVVGLINGA